MLTIGIPTYNSCTYLKEAIDKILPQILPYDDIDILVCDNASDDDTPKLVDSYCRSHPNLIRYVRHARNLGMDRNFWSVIEHAKGDFVHLHADDDFYLPDGIERVRYILNTYNVDAILLSNNYLNTRNGKILVNSDPYDEDIYCEKDGNKFFISDNLKSLCLSNIIFRKQPCLQIHNVETLFGSQWLHVGLLTRLISPSSSAYIFNFKKPVVTVRIGNQKWLERDGAISYYYNVFNLFSRLTNYGFHRRVFENYKNQLFHIVNAGGALNYNNFFMNLLYCLKFFKFFFNMPKRYFSFCKNLLINKHYPFFEGWERLGTESEFFKNN
jgi:glycosyltransferase involved in cell wall biosynthesis